MTRPTIHLWDIDGTLVSTGGAGRAAMERAFERITGERACGSFPYGGMTDRLIAREGLVRAGREVDEAAIDALLEVYLEMLVEEVPRAEGYRVMPGVREALERTRGLAGVAIGLGTGNVRRGAELKLARVGLFAEFAFGGFGCDAEERGEVIRRGAERGAERLGAPLGECRVVVIGDTERDVLAAQSIGADCLAVATGGVALDVLRASGATWAFADMAAPGALAALLGDP